MAGCRHRGDVRADQGGVPAADDGRGAVADPHREEEPRHVLLLHAGEAPAARRLHEPPAAAEAAWIGRRQRAVEHDTDDGLEFSALLHMACAARTAPGVRRTHLIKFSTADIEITFLYR